MGIRSSATCQLNFNNVKIPKENLLGKEGQGFKIGLGEAKGPQLFAGAQVGQILLLLRFSAEGVDGVGAQRGVGRQNDSGAPMAALYHSHAIFQTDQE